MENEKTTSFDCWCIIELMGHSKIAGRVTEKPLGGTSFIQVDVPAIKDYPAFTRLLNHPAIYAINPVDEATARHAAENIKSSPVTRFEAAIMVEKKATEMVNKLSEQSPDIKAAVDAYKEKNGIKSLEQGLEQEKEENPNDTGDEDLPW